MKPRLGYVLVLTPALWSLGVFAALAVLQPLDLPDEWRSAFQWLAMEIVVSAAIAFVFCHEYARRCRHAELEREVERRLASFDASENAGT